MSETTIDNPSSQDSGAAGWMVALIVLIAVIVGGFLWYRSYGGSRAASPSSTNINVTIPNPVAGSGSGAGGANQ